MGLLAAVNISHQKVIFLTFHIVLQEVLMCICFLTFHIVVYNITNVSRSVGAVSTKTLTQQNPGE